jgi:hypothetical protein
MAELTNQLWVCPEHNVALHEVDQYPGAWVHDGCPHLFTIIDNRLCQLRGNKWYDTETGAQHIVKSTKN